MKKIITLAIFLLIATPVSAKMLWEYGSFEERAEMAVDYGVVQDISQYYGNSDQNLLLLEMLEPLGTSIPSIVAVFETSLASKITSTQDTMTLVSGTTDDSTTLSGTYGFVIDEGSASQEFVLATCADTACTGMTRGISVTTGTSSVTALKKSHRRGASVKITDHPVLLTIVNILTGNGTLPSKLVYDDLSIGAGDSGDTLIDKTYADDLTAQGVATSSESTFGGVTLATPTEMASSTYDVEDPLVPNSRYATSTPWSDTIGAGYTCVTEDDGNISTDCLPLSEDWTFTGDLTNTTGTTTMDTASTSRMFIDGIDADNLVGGNNADSLHIHNYEHLATSTTSSYTITTSEIPLMATTTIPANALGTNNVIRAKINFENLGTFGNAATKTFTVRYGSSGGKSITITNSSGATINGLGGYVLAEVIAANSTSAQELNISYSFGTGIISDAATDSVVANYSLTGSSSVDSTVDQPFVILGNGSTDSMYSMNGYVEILK